MSEFSQPTRQANALMLRMRWWIVALLLIAAVLNYIDRQSLSILAVPLQRALKIGDVDYGHIVAAFLVAYTIAYAVTGKISDVIGARWSLTLFVLWWSIAEMLPTWIHGAVGLGQSRFLLGLGEAGIWVVAPKIVGEWFEARSRALAIGIYTAGGTLGAAIAPLAIAEILNRFGWQMVFFATGVAGLIWLVPWMAFSCAMRGSPQPASENSVASAGWFRLLRNRNLWLLLLARFLTDPVWYFYLFWYPKYLEQVHHVPFASMNRMVWAVYFAADMGTIIGGIVAWRLIRSGRAALRVRKLLMGLAACAFPLSPAVALVPGGWGSIAIASLLMLAHMVWLVALTAAIVDLFPSSSVGSASGWIAAGSGLGGIVFVEAIGHSITAFGYFLAFCAMGVLHPLAFLLISNLRMPSAPELHPHASLRRATV